MGIYGTDKNPYSGLFHAEFLLEYYETFRTAHLYNTSQWPIL